MLADGVLANHRAKAVAGVKLMISGVAFSPAY
jgi:hypothetical protein